MSNVKNMMCTTLTRSMPAIAFFELSNTFALVFIIYAVQDLNLTLIGVLLYYIGLMHDIDNLDEADKSKEEKEKEDDKPSTSKAKAN
ncbi:unnamed protein product [Brassica oleracea var. botrytis]